MAVRPPSTSTTAPPPVPPFPRAAPPPGPNEPPHRLEQLRLFRTEALDLRDVLRDIRTGESTLERYAAYIRATIERLDDLAAGLADDPDDCTERIRDAWEQMRCCRLLSDPDGTFGPEEQVRLLHLLERQARRIIYWTGYKTIPDRLQRWLHQSEPGYVIPFHAVFEDEMPDAEDRQRILDHLAWAPNTLDGGVVDAESGLVYRYESRGARRYMSLLWIGFAFLLATGLVIAHAEFVPDAATGWRVPLLGWLAVMLGVLVHVVIGTAKRLRDGSGHPAMLPIGRVVIMANAKLGFILLRILTALVGYAALVYSGLVDIAMTDVFLFNAFLVGYSLDSVVELFGSGLDRHAAAQQASLRKKLA